MMEITELGPDAKLSDLIIVVADRLINGKNANFEFDVHGIDPKGGAIILHFNAKIQVVGHG